MNPIRLGVTLIVGGIAAWIVFGLVGFVLHIAWKLAIVAAVVLVVYGLVSGNKPLGTGRGRLP